MLMEQIKQTLDNILSSIEYAGIFNDVNLDLIEKAAKAYEVVVVELKKTDGSKFGELTDHIDGFETAEGEARTSKINVDLYHAYYNGVVRTIETAINLL